MTQEETKDLASRLDRVESLLQQLVDRQRVQEWYTLAEFSKIVGLTQHTLRQHCRFGRLNAKRRDGGRGIHPNWAIPHEELLRYQRDGLLPDPRLSHNRSDQLARYTSARPTLVR